MDHHVCGNHEVSFAGTEQSVTEKSTSDSITVPVSP